MQTFGMLLLAAATAGDGFGYSDPGVGLKKWLRPHVVQTAAAPGPPPYSANNIGGQPGTGGPPGRRFVTTKSQIYFLDPNGLQIGWQTGGSGGERAYIPSQLTVPARYNFNQGFIYRLKISGIPSRPAASLYPTIEVAPTTPATDAYLAHNAIPVQFTPEDFDQVIDGGNFVTKVIYLPDPKYQELAVSGVETLVSTRLEPGVDPILEADKRGTILLIVRMGAIDLEAPGGGSVLAAPAGAPHGAAAVTSGAAMVPPGGTTIEMPAGALPPGLTPAPPLVATSVSLDNPAPAAAAPAPPAVIPPAAADAPPAAEPKP